MSRGEVPDGVERHDVDEVQRLPSFYKGNVE
jgi:hypothetical protein